MTTLAKSQIGLVGLAVMGQNLALNIAEHGFTISVYNRSKEKTDQTVERAAKENIKTLTGYADLTDFVQSLQKPRSIIILVQAGKPVDAVIESLTALLEPNDLIIDGGNEWFENTEKRAAAAATKNLLYLGMGVSGGEEGARNGPSLMPGGNLEAYKRVEPILLKIAAQVGGPCVTYIGRGGSGNYVKMVHNGIEYGDMQLIAEAYDVLKTIGGLTNQELHQVFSEWNKSELESFLIEITADIFLVKEDDKYVVDYILDKTGSKGTGKWTAQQAAELAIAAPTITSALDARYISSLLNERTSASQLFGALKIPTLSAQEKTQLIEDVKHALYAAKICSYAQGMNLIAAASKLHNWDLHLGDLARIWKGGCIIRAKFLDRIKGAFERNKDLASLLVDPEFTAELNVRQPGWRRIVQQAVGAGISTPALSASLAYFDSYRRQRLPANLTQAQRDYFGAHTYERIDKGGIFHTEWIANAKASK